jgi:hypothetical protein
VTAARLIPRDPALPQLADALDETRMARELGALLVVGAQEQKKRYRIRSCEITRVKYRPGRNALIGYRLSVSDPDTGAARDQLLCAGLYAAGEATSRYEKASAAARAGCVLFPPVSRIEGLGMVVWAFPNDRKLGALPVLVDAHRIRHELLPGVVRARWGEHWKIAQLAHEVVSYFPEHSCTVRADLTLENSIDGAIRPWSIFGKTRYDDAGGDTLKAMRDLWVSKAHVRGELGLARPLAYQREHRLLWQEAVEGATLDEHLGDHAPDHQLVGRLARAMAAFHGTAVVGSGKLALNNILDGLDEAARLLGLVHPRCHAQASGVIRRLRNRAATLAQAQRATLHGDLHSKNIMISGESVVLIDLDRVSEGPPLAELGSLVAEILYRGLLSCKAPRAPGGLVEILVQSYRRHAAWPVPSPEVAWYTAAALIRERVYRCLTSLKPGRMEIVDGLIELADEYSRRCCGAGDCSVSAAMQSFALPAS